MFDVIWTDPDRELVGEHRAKKDRNKDKKKPSSKDRSQRNSLSTRSSLSSGDSPFAFFKPKGLRQARSSKGSPSLESIAVAESTISSSQSIKSPSSLGFDVLKTRRTSALSVIGGASFLDSSRPSQDNSVRSKVASTGGELSPSLTSYDSIFSHSPESDGRTSNSIAERASDDLIKYEGLPRGNDHPPLDPPAETGGLFCNNLDPDIENLSLALAASTLQKPLTPPRTPVEGTTPCAVQQDEASKEPSECPTPPPKSPLRRLSQRYSSLFQHNYRDDGILTGEWNIARTGQNDRGGSGASTDHTLAAIAEGMVESDIQTGREGLEKEIARMAATSSLSIFQRLNAILKTNVFAPGEAAINVEQHHWMLSVLCHLDEGSSDSAGQRDQLVLYDAPDTATYLASLHPDRKTYHLSEHSLPDESITKVNQWGVSLVSQASFSTMSEKFDEAFSLRLPSACSSSEVMGILKNLHRALKPLGILRLALIDPSPRAATLGPHMCSWLEKNLLVNLRKHFRCTQPRQLFSHCLGEAALRGTRSTLRTTKFYAMPENVRQGHEKHRDPQLEETWADKETNAELRSLVGRSLWMLVWGSYVTADKWWWEDPLCMQECLELKTVWEYHQICAIKDGTQSVAAEPSTQTPSMF